MWQEELTPQSSGLLAVIQGSHLVCVSRSVSLWKITIGLSQPCTQAMLKCRLLMEMGIIIVRSKLLIPKRKVLFWDTWLPEKAIGRLRRGKGSPVSEGAGRQVHLPSPSKLLPRSGPPDLGQDKWVVRRRKGVKWQNSGDREKATELIAPLRYTANCANTLCK